VMRRSYQNLLGLASGYLLLLVGYALGASGFGIFLAFLIEIVALLIVHTLFRIRDEKANPQNYRKQASVWNLYFGIVPFIFVQYLMIWVILSQVSAHFYVPTWPELLQEWQNWLIFAYLILFYVLRYRHEHGMKAADQSRNRFVVSLLLFTAINMLGATFVHLFDHPNFFLVLLAMVITRILLEYFLNKKFELSETRV
jgi:hypothetical protein